MKWNVKWRGVLLVLPMMILTSHFLNAGKCSSKLFTVTINNQLSIGDAIENLADTCDLTVIVKDEWAKKKLDEKLYFVKLKNTTMRGFLDTILKDNGLHYNFKNDKLKISYLSTRTFRIHYISGQRIGKSRANVIISDSSNTAYQNSVNHTGNPRTGSETGISIENKDEFVFWKTVESEVQRVLMGAADNGIHYTRAGNAWIGPDGKKWEYNPLAPIVNPGAGLVTVTGTDEQLARVARYISALRHQLKTQVLIDVRILTVTFDDSRTTGVDWSQLYKLQNMTINSYAMGRKNILSWSNGPAGITGNKEFAQGVRPTGAGVIELSGSTPVSEVIKFLATQGEVKAVSSPRVMTLNNQPAMISVGEEIYYKLRSNTVLPGSGSIGTGASTEGEYVNSVFAGVLLDITPEIGNNGMITLKINPSITKTSEPLSEQSGVRTIPPNMIKRQLATVIKVKNGHHAILGGLITSQTGTKVNKVPLLGDLPLFEYAFKHEEKIEKVIELVLIVTPHIVNDSKDVSLRDLGYERAYGK